MDSVGLGLAGTWALAGIVCWDGVLPPVASVGGLAAATGLALSRLSRPGHGAAPAAATMCGALGTALWFQWLMALPDGRLPSRVRRRAVLLVYGLAAAAGIVLVLFDQALSLPFALTGGLALTLVSVPAIRNAYSRAGSGSRDRLRWVGGGVAAACTATVVVIVLHALVGWPGPVLPVVLATGGLVAAATVAGRTSLATSGGRVLVHTLWIAGFALVASAIYLVVLGLVQPPRDRADREALALSIVAASIAAVIYVPARRRLLASATRLVYGAREAPDEVVRTFGRRLTRAVPMDELLLQLAESLRRTMGLTSAAVYTGSGEVLERVASVPDGGPRSIFISERERPVVAGAAVSGNAWIAVWLPAILQGRSRGQLRVAAIRNTGELLGLLVMERAGSGDPFSESEDRVLSDLAREVGVALRNVQLDTTLQQTLAELRTQAAALRNSRARIVASGDAERRRLERNLHDGAQQNLVALAVNLRLARDMIEENPAGVAEILDHLMTDVQTTIQEVRELAHGIYPPLLMDGGLLPALRAAASRHPDDVSVKVETPTRHPSDVEAAIYFCCLEALQNAGKHAAGARVRVRVWEAAGGLLFSVADDGPGFDVDTVASGHGFVNMVDRLGAIGGTVTWESARGEGTRVQGSLPLPTESGPGPG
jgi:signal transduction histidine kinase